MPPRSMLWGSGTPRREFLHVDDLADACLFLLEHYDDPEPINVGIGEDVDDPRARRSWSPTWSATPARSATTPSKPDGTPRKLLDVSRLRALGVEAFAIEPRATVSRATYAWYLKSEG